MKHKYVKVNNKWYLGSHISQVHHKDENCAYWTDNEAMLLRLGDMTKIYLLQKYNRKKQPIAIIVD